MALTEQINSDRRKSERTAISNCMFDANMKFGRIIDISDEGMAFYYVDRKAWPDNEILRGTLCYKSSRPIKNLQVFTVSDIEVPNSPLPGAISVRRRSVRFGKLTFMQKKKLHELMEKHAQR